MLTQFSGYGQNYYQKKQDTIIGDDYPITNSMLAKATDHNSKSYRSGQLVSHDKAWFCNDTLDQAIVFVMYTDFHRLITYHFYKDSIPIDLIDRMPLNLANGDLATQEQKLIDLEGFLNQSVRIGSSFFVSEYGFKLGDSKEKATQIYGEPDKQTVTGSTEILSWSFRGDMSSSSSSGPENRPIVKNSFGYDVMMYFKNNKLLAQILYNNAP